MLNAPAPAPLDKAVIATLEKITTATLTTILCRFRCIADTHSGALRTAFR